MITDDCAGDGLAASRSPRAVGEPGSRLHSSNGPPPPQGGREEFPRHPRGSTEKNTSSLEDQRSRQPAATPPQQRPVQASDTWLNKCSPAGHYQNRACTLRTNPVVPLGLTPRFT
jgi:hypothetical protein